MSAPLDRTHLPLPDTPSGGVAGPTIADSVMPTIQPIRPPAGAPNVVIVLLDDVGFGATATFGGPVPTPVGDELASRGVALQPVPHHVAVFADPGRIAHG